MKILVRSFFFSYLLQHNIYSLLTPLLQTAFIIHIQSSGTVPSRILIKLFCCLQGAHYGCE